MVMCDDKCPDPEKEVIEGEKKSQLRTDLFKPESGCSTEQLC